MGDRISSLPDEIISHILSFLPTKYAVATSGLSRRWKNLWTELYELDLDNRDDVSEDIANSYEIRERRDLEFCRFVDRVLSQHRDLNSLRRLRFHYAADYPDRKARTNFWLKMGLAPDQSQLEEMDLKLEEHGFMGDPSVMRCLPESFYNLKHLKVLKLQGITIEITAQGFVFLPSVKILQLLRAVTKDCAALSKLISVCPVLETIRIENCYSSNRNENDKLTASLPFLKNFNIIGNSSYDNPLCPIMMDAPNLEQLSLRHFGELQFMGSSSLPLACLHSAQVEIGHSQISKHGLIRLLSQISNAKQMRLSCEIPNILFNVNEEIQLPIFPNLTHLTIGTPRSSSVLHSLLSSASRLQSLCIVLEEGEGGLIEWSASEEPACTAECLLLCLEEIKIENLKADADEMRMVAYLLKAGAVLKKVNILTCYGIDGYDHRRYMRDPHSFLNFNYYCKHLRRRGRFASLLKLSRGSGACEARLFLPNGDEVHVYSDDETDDDDFDWMNEGGTDDDNGGTDDDSDDVSDDNDLKSDTDETGDEIHADDGDDTGISDDGSQEDL